MSEKVYVSRRAWKRLVALQKKADASLAARFQAEAEQKLRKLDWLYGREPEYPERRIHEDKWWDVSPLIGGVAADCQFDLDYDEAEDFARAILRTVEEGRAKEKES